MVTAGNTAALGLEERQRTECHRSLWAQELPPTAPAQTSVWGCTVTGAGVFEEGKVSLKNQSLPSYSPKAKSSLAFCIDHELTMLFLHFQMVEKNVMTHKNYF